MRILMSMALVLGCACCAIAKSADVNQAVQSGACEGGSGVGLDERESMAVERPDHNLLLTFATKGTGEYQADVAVTVSDKAGKPVASFTSPGPICYLNLEPGRYRISATVHGDTLSKTADVRGRGAHELYFYWEP